MIEIKPKELHKWYLEAIKNIHKENYNPNANKPYSKLNKEQKYIDEYIAYKINCKINVKGI